jgi:uncharacterized membrane protein YjjP (DUF1212 family)
MAQVDYNSMNGVEVLWHLFTGGDKGFLIIISVGVIALLFSFVYDRYFDKKTQVQHTDYHDLYR